MDYQLPDENGDWSHVHGDYHTAAAHHHYKLHDVKEKYLDRQGRGSDEAGMCVDETGYRFDVVDNTWKHGD